LQATLVEFGYRLHDADLAGVQVDVVAPEPGQLTPAQAREGGKENQHPVPHRDRVRDRENHGQRDDLPLLAGLRKDGQPILHPSTVAAAVITLDAGLKYP
jgi:hypothetical protein